MKRDIGHLIEVLPENISSPRGLTVEEQAKAKEIAKVIGSRNWHPIFVRELTTHNYELIDGCVILEAVKLAGNEVVFCIQIDSSDEEEQVIKEQDILFKSNKIFN